MAIGRVVSFIMNGVFAPTDVPAEEMNLPKPKVEEKPAFDIKKLVHTPHFYRLTSSRLHPEGKEHKENRQLRFFVLGCAGEGTPGQKKVAEIMAQAKEKPDFIIFLGDNIYDHGVDTPMDPAFATYFEEVYKSCGVPCFVILGNHDYNICRNGNTGGVINEQKAAAQVIHSYLDEKGEMDLTKLALYAGETLDLAKLPLWNMASRFVVLHLDGATNLFLADTNTFLIEYALFLAMQDEKTKEKIDLGLPAELEKTFCENNQAAYFVKMYREHPAKRNLIFKHHPSHTIGKRSEPDLDDAWQYLNTKVLTYLRSKGLTGSLYDMLKKAFHDLGLLFDVEFVAHDHMNYVYMDETGTELVIGGGGGEPQDRVEYKTAENVPYCESGEKHGGIHGFGYADVVIDLDTPEKNILFAINNTQGDRYEFSPNNKIARRQADEANSDLISFHRLVLCACDDFLKMGQVGWGRTGATMNALGVTAFKKIAWLITPNPKLDAVQKIKNYFNEYKTKTMMDYIRFVKDRAPAEFIKLLDEKFLKETKHGMFEKLYESFSPILTSVSAAETKADVVAESKEVSPVTKKVEALSPAVKLGLFSSTSFPVSARPSESDSLSSSATL